MSLLSVGKEGSRENFLISGVKKDFFKVKNKIVVVKKRLISS